MTFLRAIPRSGISSIALAALLSGCAHYMPLSLATAPPLAETVGELSVAPPTGGPLSIEQVVTLALANNPDLKAARLKRAVAAGQTKQSGILPNPSLAGAILPLISGAGTVPAWNIGLSQDIKSIITYKSRRRAARDSEQQVAADVVWQEWQVAGKARQLATALIIGARSRPYYVAAYELLTERNATLEQALAARNTTMTIVAPDRVALQTARTALNSFDQNQLSLIHQLNALLGLRPDVVVPLTAAPALPPFDPAAIRAGLAPLPDRRPDLLALRRPTNPDGRRSSRNFPTWSWAAASRATIPRSSTADPMSRSACRASTTTRAISRSPMRRARSFTPNMRRGSLPPAGKSRRC